MMHFSPCFRFPPIFDKFSDSVENFQNVTFSRQNFRFSSAKISDDLFLVIDHKFSPYFPCFSTCTPCFAKIIISPPTFKNFLPVFEKFTCFLHTLCVFCFPPTLTMMHLCITPVLPNLCAAGHRCAVRAVTVYRGRMSEVKSFQREVSMKLLTLIESLSFLHIGRGTLLPLYQIENTFQSVAHLNFGW